MSAYIVSNETISALVRGFEIYNTRLLADDYIQNTSWIIDLNEERQKMGQALLNLNTKSVNYRYNEDEPAPKFEFKDVEVNPCIIYGCIQCYNYQTCELDDYYQSQVYKSLQDLKENMLKRVVEDQYGEYPWGYPEPEPEPELKPEDVKNPYNLEEIKQELESVFDIEFTYSDFAGIKCIKNVKDKCTLNIYISQYAVEPYEWHIAFMWDTRKNGYSGFGRGYTEVKFVIEKMDELGYPRRTPIEENEEIEGQISLF